MTFRKKRVNLDVMIGQTANDVFIKVLLSRKVSTMYVALSEINEFWLSPIRTINKWTIIDKLAINKTLILFFTNVNILFRTSG